MTNISEHNRKVAIKRWEKIFDAKSKQITENSAKYPHLKAQLIAYIMGDGCATIRKEKTFNHHTIYFFPDDNKMLKAFLDAFQKIYGFIPNVKRLHNHYRVRADSKAIVTDLLKLGSLRSLEWHLPKKLLTSKTEKREWLRAFYDCEGYVGPKVITVQSVNEKGLLEVQNLLREFGINSKMYTYKRKQPNWNTNYLLNIVRKDDRRRFLKHVGFNHSVKQRKLKLFAGIA